MREAIIGVGEDWGELSRGHRADVPFWCDGLGPCISRGTVASVQNDQLHLLRTGWRLSPLSQPPFVVLSKSGQTT